MHADAGDDQKSILSRHMSPAVEAGLQGFPATQIFNSEKCRLHKASSSTMRRIFFWKARLQSKTVDVLFITGAGALSGTHAVHGFVEVSRRERVRCLHLCQRRVHQRLHGVRVHPLPLRHTPAAPRKGRALGCCCCCSCCRCWMTAAKICAHQAVLALCRLSQTRVGRAPGNDDSNTVYRWTQSFSVPRHAPLMS